MVKYTGALPKESLVDIEAKVVKAPQEIKNCSQKQIELQILKDNDNLRYSAMLV